METSLDVAQDITLLLTEKEDRELSSLKRPVANKLRGIQQISDTEIIKFRVFYCREILSKTLKMTRPLIKENNLTDVIRSLQ